MNPTKQTLTPAVAAALPAPHIRQVFEAGTAAAWPLGADAQWLHRFDTDGQRIA